MKRFRRVYFLLASIAALAWLGLALPALADTVVQSFNASGTIHPDWVVAIKPGTSNTVELAPSDDSGLIYGVAIDPSLAPITLQNGGSNQVFVASNGTYPVLVSTQNGNINPGDYLSISATSGIAAKASSSQASILGKALQKFNGSSGVLTTGPGGSSVGVVNVSINPGRNPLINSQVPIPGPLKDVANSLAGKEVSPLRIYTAMAVFLVSVAVAFNITVVGIRSAMTAIGRNPLSRHSILRSLVQLVIVTILVLFLGVFGVYLLLRL